MAEVALPELPAHLERLRARPTAKAGDWYRIEAKAGARSAVVSIYDEIGWAGTTAKDFAAELRALDADDITLRLNSPGGDAWDGIAIFNALKDHRASVHVVVDGLAASAASFIAQAGDRVTMNRGAQMMIHDAAGLAIGNARDMRDMAEVLDRVSDSIASIYAARSGRPMAEFRTAMARDTWYTAQEAVDAGLADEVADDPDATATNSSRQKVTAAEAARRIHAAAQRTTPVNQAGDAPEKGAGRMDPAKIREALGLAPGASDDEVKAALGSAGLVENSQPTQPAPSPSPSEPAPAPSSPRPSAAGTMVIDASAWEAQQEAIRQLQAADARRRRDERDEVVNQAVRDGKFAPARKDHWTRLWDADPEGTREVINGLQKNVIPTAALGYAGPGDDADFEMEFAGLFPPNRKGA
ncbi:Clp protease ClpP [Micromonospora sp. WMMC241]|uniref:head maturation protease, ClpP-related n=1 Tax=Micromonospora sp. WMMC241 TaxID=3015159 RepID=UPI0022B6725E|nr:head maturation protease, ClpP-related [Micromonospora sp. WMMC241]MCZ7440826.1 Clp protease ClpP [Micromonospora sp. WMMC241]MCZ7440919.1 Clp protease ClpP [Micromonospora sp. WMMC241]